MKSVYDAAGGTEGLFALAQAWHARCLEDPLMSHPFSHPGQHPRHLERLAAYWAEALGGPPAFSDSMGDETHVRKLHAGNGAHPELDRRAVECFDAALEDLNFEDPLRRTLHEYFAWSTQRMAEHPSTPDTVPGRLSIPRWSWDGLVDL